MSIAESVVLRHSTADRDERIQRLWETTSLTARQIGELVGLTKNAIIGMADRHDWKARKGGRSGAILESVVTPVITKTAISLPVIRRRYPQLKRQELPIPKPETLDERQQELNAIEEFITQKGNVRVPGVGDPEFHTLPELDYNYKTRKGSRRPS